MIITLCGSARFENGFHHWNKRLTMDGHVVFSLTAFPSIEGKKNWYDLETKIALDDAHKKKIDASDAIFVIDEWETSELYTGESTTHEIAHAEAGGKKIFRSSRTCANPRCSDRFNQRPPCAVCRG